MTKRLPSIRQLETNPGNASDIISVWFHDLQRELDELESGVITISDGRTRAHNLRLVRERMKRVRIMAQHFDVHLPTRA